ncbi:hypothetical protein DSECCO2_412270 [anaerobic digester metagenome]
MSTKSFISSRTSKSTSTAMRLGSVVSTCVRMARLPLATLQRSSFSARSFNPSGVRSGFSSPQILMPSSSVPLSLRLGIPADSVASI